MKTNRHYYQFWICSSRGTDECAVVEFKSKPTKDEIEASLERWCSRHCCWDSSGNFISYGFRPVKPLLRREILKKYEAVCKRERAINERRKVLAGMLNPVPAF